MDEYTRGVQDGLKAAADKWAARCARAEHSLAELRQRIEKLEQLANRDLPTIYWDSLSNLMQ